MRLRAARAALVVVAAALLRIPERVASAVEAAAQASLAPPMAATPVLAVGAAAQAVMAAMAVHRQQLWEEWLEERAAVWKTTPKAISAEEAAVAVRPPGRRSL
jgi:hypothetical protein